MTQPAENITEETVQPKQPDEKPLAPEDYYAHRVVVPVSNPKTAPHLIELAACLAHPENGKVKVLYISRPNSPFQDSKEQISHITKRANERGLPVEFISISAPSVSRGVLDVTREVNADLLVLGFQAPKDGKVVIGAITEDVARVVPHDLIVYRHVVDEDVKRIVVPITNLAESRTAMIHALHLADIYEVPIVAYYVVDNTPSPYWREDKNPAWLQRSQIYDALNELPDSAKIDTKVLHSEDLVNGIVERCTENDLIVMTVRQNRNQLEQRWLFGVTAQKMLRLAPGPIALVRRAQHKLTRRELIMRQIARWTPTLTSGETSEVIQQASDLTRTNTNYVVMITIACIIATMGLLQNSAAVIIGAMLVAPLMSPLMGFGVGLAIGQLDMMRRSFATVVHGILIVLVTAAFFGFITQIPSPTNEMLSRGKPNLLDMVVAIASGAAGAFAMARRDLTSALAGVAIAAALVPPICTTGIAFAMQDYNLMIGAGTLSLVNVICISIAAAGTFAILGVRHEGTIPLRNRLLASIGILILMAIPLTILLNNVYVQTNAEHEVKTILERDLPRSQVIDIDIKIEGQNALNFIGRQSELDITVTIQTPNDISRQQIVAVEDQLEEILGREVTLDAVILKVIRVE